jgi:hypothetical protein
LFSVVVIDILYDLYTSWIWNYHLGWHQVCLKFKCVPNNLSHIMYELWTSVCYVQGCNPGYLDLDWSWYRPDWYDLRQIPASYPYLPGRDFRSYQFNTKAKLVSISSIYLPHTRQKWALNPNTFWTMLVWLCLNHVVFLLFLTFPVSAKLERKLWLHYAWRNLIFCLIFLTFSLLVFFFFSCSPYKVLFLFLHTTILPPHSP